MLNTNKKQNQSNLIGIPQPPADAGAKSFSPKGVGCLHAVDDVNAKWQKRFDDFQEETEAKYKKQMKAMAAEYEAKIAELQNQKDGKGGDKDHTPGKSTKNARKHNK